MTTLSICARFPLGVYTGHGPEGAPERLPGVARLFSALVQSGALGSLATGNPASPYTQEVIDALDWLENTPPDAMFVPAVQPVGPRGRAFTYRKEGVFLKENSKINYKVTERDLSRGTALGEELRWIWHDVDVTALGTVISTLESLCSDVPHLGETSSPVQLTVLVDDGAAATHRITPEAGLTLPPGALRQSVPTVGRRNELDAAHAALHSGKPPSAARDKHTLSAGPHAPLPPRARLTTAVFSPVEDVELPAPWTHVLSVPVPHASGAIPEEHHVSICVALHRALVSQLGPGAPPEITGKYAPGDIPAANRVAIHYVPGDVPSLPGTSEQDRFLLLIPQGIPGQALGALASALSGVRRVVTRDHQLNIAPEEVEVFDGAAFWEPPAGGMTRSWEAYPAVTAERRLKPVAGIRDVDLAAAWSLGNVLRELVPDAATREPSTRHAELTARGARFHGRALRTLTPTAYVHRTDRRGPVQPYRLSLSLGNLLPSTAVAALGQSRHLGCGLLLPVDLPSMPEETS